MYLLNFPSCLHLFFPNRRNAVHFTERQLAHFAHLQRSLSTSIDKTYLSPTCSLFSNKLSFSKLTLSPRQLPVLSGFFFPLRFEITFLLICYNHCSLLSKQLSFYNFVSFFIFTALSDGTKSLYLPTEVYHHCKFAFLKPKYRLVLIAMYNILRFNK